MKKCDICPKVLGVLRIILGAAMLWFGSTKIGVPDMEGFVGGSAHSLGLTFLSVQTWFWIAIIGELVAGAMIISGWKAKWGAGIVLIIMAFAFTATGRFNPNAIIITILAILIIWKGPGAWALDDDCCSGSSSGKSCCGMGGCCSKKGSDDATSEE